MKKLIYLLLAVTLFTACSSDDDNDQTQDYTSFVFEQTVDNKLPNCVAAYMRDGKFYKLGDLGDLNKKGQQSPEITVTDNSIKEVYFFTDYNGCIRGNSVFTLKSNNKNIFKLLEGMGGIKVDDKSDPTQYPQ